jgi:hypothetical protein
VTARRRRYLALSAITGAILLASTGGCTKLAEAASTASCTSLGSRLGLVLISYGVGQCVVAFLGRALRARYSVEAAVSRDEDKLPPGDMGLVESIAYPLLFFKLKPEAAASLVVGWVALKTFGDWKAWQQERRKEPPGLLDVHQGRRRLYIFMMQNAVLVGFGLVIGWAMARV